MEFNDKLFFRNIYKFYCLTIEDNRPKNMKISVENLI